MEAEAFAWPGGNIQRGARVQCTTFLTLMKYFLTKKKCIENVINDGVQKNNIFLLKISA